MAARLAIDGGRPVRNTLLPYGRHAVSARDVRAVVAALRSEWLTTGPAVDAFETAFATTVGAQHAVAVSTGTAALHGALVAAKVKPGDEVIVPAITFVATANAAAFLGAIPQFADVDPNTLLIDPASVEKLVSRKTRAIIGVDYAGQPCDWTALRAIAKNRHLALLADGCHALGAKWRGQNVGTLADLTTFSFHPVKHIATGEGGMVSTQSVESARVIRTFRNHGITADFRQREKHGTFHYDQTMLGNNYRLSDIQCALGTSQLGGLAASLKRRRTVAAAYDAFFRKFDLAKPLSKVPGATHAYHLYVIRLSIDRLRAKRTEVFRALRAEGIGVAVHYRPVYLHSYYANKFGYAPGLCPRAEASYETILSLPIFPSMTNADVEDVKAALEKVAANWGT